MDEIRRALLGDRAAQERLTDGGVLLPCRCKYSVLAIKSYRRNGVMRNYVLCAACGSQTSICETEKEAIREWNTRAPILSAEELEAIDGKL